MTKQPEALRLAIELDGIFISEEIHATKAKRIAAELRRLHAENEALHSELRMEQTISFRVQMQQYAAQRDELLEALSALVGWEETEAEHFGAEGPDDWLMEKARAAIAKAEGGAA